MELTRSLLKELVHYDPDTGEIVKLPPPRRLYVTAHGHSIAFSKITGKPENGRHNRGYIKVFLCGRTHFAHRLAILYTYGEIASSDFIDHINGDESDNRIINLRICDHTRNMKNQRKTIGGSKYKGVSLSNKGKSFRATIQSDGRKYRLGTFDNEVSAALMYDRMAVKLHGEFACTNKDLGLL